MKNVLERFRYQKPLYDPEDVWDEDIHIAGDGGIMHETLCGNVDSGMATLPTDEMPTCTDCLRVYNMIKNGKLRR